MSTCLISFNQIPILLPIIPLYTTTHLPPRDLPLIWHSTPSNPTQSTTVWHIERKSEALRPVLLGSAKQLYVWGGIPYHVTSTDLPV